MWYDEILISYPFIVSIIPEEDVVVVENIFGGKKIFENYWGHDRLNTKEQILSYCRRLEECVCDIFRKRLY